jgi:hypothetical protein
MSSSLQREIEGRRKRAAALGVDKLVCGLWFDRSLRHYGSLSKRAEYRYDCIATVTHDEDGRLDIAMGGASYSLRTKRLRHWSSSDGAETLELELCSADQLVFGQLIALHPNEYAAQATPGLTTAFIEGPWIDHFRALEAEAKAAETRNRQRTERDLAAKEATRFGLASQSLTEGDVPEPLGEATKGTLAVPIVLAGGLFGFLLALLCLLGIIGLLVFGLKQLF